MTLTWPSRTLRKCHVLICMNNYLRMVIGSRSLAAAQPPASPAAGNAHQGDGVVLPRVRGPEGRARLQAAGAAPGRAAELGPVAAQVRGAGGGLGQHQGGAGGGAEGARRGGDRAARRGGERAIPMRPMSRRGGGRGAGIDHGSGLRHL